MSNVTFVLSEPVCGDNVGQRRENMYLYSFRSWTVGNLMAEIDRVPEMELATQATD
jgi:hypothetical protein